MTGSNAIRFALGAIAVVLSGCTTTGSSSGGLPPGAVRGAVAGPAANRLVGPGAVLTSKFGGEILGWAIDENGTDGVLTEITGVSEPYTSIVETFNQTTAQAVKVVRKQKSGPQGNRELVADAIQANDVGLIDDELRHSGGSFRDKYYVMSPVTKNKVTGIWTQPYSTDFLIWDIADQQVSSDSAIAATVIDNGISKPPTFELVVTDLATNKTSHVLYAPKGDGVNYPYLVAEDTSTHHAYVPAANYSSETVFMDFDVRSGRVSNNFVAPAFSGPVTGIAVDSATHMMCTTTHSTYSVQMYDLTTKKQIFVGQIPNSGGEGQAGTSIAADPINHLFLVAQPNSLRGGSEIYVYDEKGNVLESLTGFDFPSYELTPGSALQVVASSRSGYVPGPAANQLQSFTY